MPKSRNRGFENVSDENKKYGETTTLAGRTITLFPIVDMPMRADKGSAGYDFPSPIDVMIPPRQQVLIWTNIKAYMGDDEYLQLHVRSSLGIKKGLRLANVTGIIDNSYYNNPDNEGNIGICLKNTTGKGIEIKQGERIAQGIFAQYLTADEDFVMKDERTGGIGSSN